MYINVSTLGIPMSFADKIGPYVWRDIHVITYFDRSARGLRQCVEEGYPCHTCRPNFVANRAHVENCEDAWTWWYRLHNVVNKMKGKPIIDASQVDQLQAYPAWRRKEWRAYWDRMRQRYCKDGNWYPGFMQRMATWGRYVRRYEMGSGGSRLPDVVGQT